MLYTKKLNKKKLNTKEINIKTGKKFYSIRLHKINEEIKAKTVRLTGINGVQLGIVPIKEAIFKSLELEMDLVEISPNSNPPVCKIMNYGKFLYEKNKSNKEQKRKQKIINTKEIKFRPNTDTGDYKVKLRNLTRFLENGKKVKISLRFRGREMVHKKIGINMLNRICSDLKEISSIESFPNKIEGRQMTLILVPKK
ncbi:infC [Wigglesworthia glossinidia endosymbiont of Glossina brevipalpis]|uniref:Translation initiation factor IF-3 n=1 Tax=Wigglesworthia glossinidia brevipalpis TaxID=36870 RepID=IF3_WIGBR|nr:RecName: Full=Translation initiation factor IF-3 [Wigglesworthia glossinidia endosymbiont of Glossina brevipalpis]BAC24228.1 infC [Wigglesworthia glossinidia endosymbiont of Glossina brevipalpis]